MEKILLFVISFVISFICYYVSVVLQSKKYDKYKKGTQVKFFEKKYGLKFKNITIKQFFTLLSFIYSFIISFTVLAVSFINGLLWQLLLSLVIMVPLIILSYSILGNYIRKKEK